MNTRINSTLMGMYLSLISLCAKGLVKEVDVNWSPESLHRNIYAGFLCEFASTIMQSAPFLIEDLFISTRKQSPAELIILQAL